MANNDSLTSHEELAAIVRRQRELITRLEAEIVALQAENVELKRQIEHQLMKRRCGCGTVSCGAAPQDVIAPTQYGLRITAIIVYLHVGQFLSKQLTAQALSELVGTPVSQGTVSTMTQRTTKGLDEFIEMIRGYITCSLAVGFTETGLRVAGVAMQR